MVSNFQCQLSLRKELSCLVGVLLLLDVPLVLLVLGVLLVLDVPLVLDVLLPHYLVCPALGRGWFAIVDWYSQHIVWHIALHS